MTGMARVLSALVIALVAASAAADEVTDAIAAAQSAYAAGNLTEAAARLDAALGGVNGLIAHGLAECLPIPPQGWTAGDAEGIGADAADPGSSGGIVVSRGYTAPDGSSIEVSIAVDSPLLGSVRMLVTSPGLGGSGIRKTTVCGNDAIEDSDARGVREISILVGSRTLVSVSGRDGGDAPHVQALAAVTDCQGIAARVSR